MINSTSFCDSFIYYIHKKLQNLDLASLPLVSKCMHLGMFSPYVYVLIIIK